MNRSNNRGLQKRGSFSKLLTKKPEERREEVERSQYSSATINSENSGSAYCRRLHDLKRSRGSPEENLVNFDKITQQLHSAKFAAALATYEANEAAAKFVATRSIFSEHSARLRKTLVDGNAPTSRSQRTTEINEDLQPKSEEAKDPNSERRRRGLEHQGPKRSPARKATIQQLRERTLRDQSFNENRCPSQELRSHTSDNPFDDLQGADSDGAICEPEDEENNEGLEGEKDGEKLKVNEDKEGGGDEKSLLEYEETINEQHTVLEEQESVLEINYDVNEETKREINEIQRKNRETLKSMYDEEASWESVDTTNTHFEKQCIGFFDCIFTAGL